MKHSRTIMIQGTASSCGKSIIAAALCRIFKEDGFEVAPFKSQNMALNSFVTKEGGEMGRAQVVQAAAAGIEPHTDMNPILLKPSGDETAQVIVQGKAVGNMSVNRYIKNKKKFFKKVKESFKRLQKQHNLLVIEGAGSPAEVNLKSHDIVNMKMAAYAKSPVILVSDIDKGGVFASLVGTMELLNKKEKDMIKGFIINKFRGNKALLENGLSFLERRTGKKVLGVVPYINGLKIPEEDAAAYDKLRFSEYLPGKINIAVIHFPHISNFTDFDPFLVEGNVSLSYVKDIDELKNPDVIILPGTKSTINDLKFMREKGFEKVLRDFSNRGTRIIGICGGFQILGKEIVDINGVESSNKFIKGLGLLEMKTYFKPEKVLRQVKAIYIKSGLSIKGYEIHMGRTCYKNQKPLFKIDKGNFDGTQNQCGNVWGTYIHGIFDNDNFRKGFLDSVRAGRKKNPRIGQRGNFNPEKEISRFADTIRDNINMKEIYKIVGIQE